MIKVHMTPDGQKDHIMTVSADQSDDWLKMTATGATSWNALRGAVEGDACTWAERGLTCVTSSVSR